MRVLGVGYHVALGDLYLRLIARGHEVRVYADDADADDILSGLVPRTRDWRSELPWLRQAPDCGLLVFEGTGWGETQDQLRREGYHVIGSSALGDRLELDRAYGQSVAREVGIQVAETFPFDSFDAAIAFVEQRPARYVLKFDGDIFAKTRNYVAVLEHGEDMLAMLRMQRAKWPLSEAPRFVLMEHLSGVEVGVGGFFDGEKFLTPVNLDFEHKRFFPGNLGELTGEMGTLVSYRGAERLFEATLAKLAGRLSASHYVGYINLNMIVNERGAFPLEFTCRLGVPGFAILSALHEDPWDVLLERLAKRRAPSFRTHDGFAVGVVLTVPPFPYPDGYERLSKGALIYLHDLSRSEYERLHFGELRREGEQLVTAGQIGYVMVVTGRGASVPEARMQAYALAKKVVVPNVRYRVDIGEGYELHDRAELMRLGWL
ncbi:MAG: phosphoribosylglycinamide synthetase [Myxococcaceae bacterium]|nr:phosphoribosylglycinamide synthetase [Myxococcaceae bacterium]